MDGVKNEIVLNYNSIGCRVIFLKRIGVEVDYNITRKEIY